MSKSKRRIVMFNQVSADGYFAAPDGKLDWVVQEPEVHKAATQSMRQVDTMLFGRKTYENFEAFWPHALDDSKTSPNPHAAGERSAQMREMAVWINESKKLVVSRTRKAVPWKNSTLLHELDPAAIEALKNGPGQDIIIFGSGSVVSQLSKYRLIDEYQFVVSPLLLGQGRTLLGDLDSKVALELVDAKSYTATGVVVLRYAPAK
jgi:dihydrofolate reductase